MNSWKQYTELSRIAYFSMEIGLTTEIPTYSGGLGVLAGDTIKSAADLKLPMVAVTLISRKGYFRQSFDEQGWQQESSVDWRPEELLELLAPKLAGHEEVERVQVAVGPELRGEIADRKPAGPAGGEQVVAGVLWGVGACFTQAISIVIVKPHLGDWPLIWTTFWRLVGGVVVHDPRRSRRGSWVSRRPSRLAALSPPIPRLPPGAGNQADKLEYDDLELAKKGYLYRLGQVDGQALAVRADRESGVVALPVGLAHLSRTLLRWREVRATVHARVRTCPPRSLVLPPPGAMVRGRPVR